VQDQRGLVAVTPGAEGAARERQLHARSTSTRASSVV
jgi:hypothetical protein